MPLWLSQSLDVSEQRNMFETSVSETLANTELCALMLYYRASCYGSLLIKKPSEIKVTEKLYRFQNAKAMDMQFLIYL